MSDSISSLTSRMNRFTRPRWLAFVALIAALFFSASVLAQTMGSVSLHTERRGHSATLLQDGTVLIVGGENQNGIVSQAEILNPASLSSAPVIAAGPARTDHAASLLQDGRVLVSGGRAEAGELASTHIYDPATGEFSAGPSMMRPRSGHTATRLSDGKILMTGGDPSGSAEIYDPETNSFSLISGSLHTARKYHSAIRLHNGQVLIVGGIDAQNTILNTAEIFEPQVQAFYPPVNTLEIPRALATLRRLPDGKVQVIGGDSDFSMEIFDPELGNFNAVAYLPPAPDYLGATLSTRSRAALVSPTASQNPNMLGIPLSSELLDLLDRADHTITELPSRNQALVAGGVNSTGQVLNSATLVQSSPASITTDYTDYAPGEFVIITGTGFLPNEDIEMILHERPDEYPARLIFEATADSQGNFMYGEFAPKDIDIGRAFTLTAVGASSRFTAQTVFTDAPRIGSVTIGAQSPALYAGTGGSTAFSYSVNRGSNNVAPISATISVSGLPSGVTVSSGTGTVNVNGCSSNGCTGFSGTLTLNVASSVAAGSYPFTVTATSLQGANDDASATGTLVLNSLISLTPLFSASNKDYDGNENVSVSLTGFTPGVDGDDVSVTWISASFDNKHVGNGKTVTIFGLALTGTDAFKYMLVSNSVTTVANITPKFVTASINAQNKTYDGTTAVTITNCTVDGKVNGDDVACTTNNAQFSDANAGTGKTVTANVVLVGSEAGNYQLSSATAMTTADINKALADVLLSNMTQTYTGSPLSPTATTTPSDLTIVWIGAPQTNAGSYPVTATVDDPNYEGSASGTFMINKANAIINVVGYIGVYDGLSHGATGSATGVNGEDLSALLNLGATSTNVPGGTADWNFAGNINYNPTSGSVLIVIQPRKITVTADYKSKIYGDPDPELTYKITDGELVTGDNFVTGSFLTRVSGQNVGQYDILQGTLALSSNYELTVVGAKLTITKRPITVTADSKSKIYGASDPELTYQITSGSLGFSSDYFTGALSRGAGELVGMYEIQQGTLSINNIDNYNLTYVSAYLTITTGFAFNGFHSPIGGSVENGNGGSYASPLKTFKLNSTIPVKFSATWLNGGGALISGIHTLQAIKYSNAATAMGDPIDATPTDAATTGNQFRLTGTDWHFNLSTKGNGISDGIWLFIATLEDGSKHTVWVAIKK